WIDGEDAVAFFVDFNVGPLEAQLHGIQEVIRRVVRDMRERERAMGREVGSKPRRGGLVAVANLERIRESRRVVIEEASDGNQSNRGRDADRSPEQVPTFDVQDPEDEEKERALEYQAQPRIPRQIEEHGGEEEVT